MKRKAQSDVFIAHCSEDKTLVTPLAATLSQLGINVWLDEFELKPGDSLSESIDRGLAQSRFGIVVLSRTFFKKPWPKRELAGMVAQIMRPKTKHRMIPILHGIELDEVVRRSPPLGDLVSLNTSVDSPDMIASKLLHVIKPELYDYLRHNAEWLEATKDAPKVKLTREELGEAIRNSRQIIHLMLPDALVIRARLVYAVLAEVLGSSWPDFHDGFRRDAHPDREIAWWERLATAFLEYTASQPMDPDQRREAFILLFAIAMGRVAEPDQANLRRLSSQDVKNIASTLEILSVNPDNGPRRPSWSPQANDYNIFAGYRFGGSSGDVEQSTTDEL